MTQQEQDVLWTDEAIDNHIRYHSYMGMSERQMADRAFKGAGASVIETHYVQIFWRKIRNDYEARIRTLEQERDELRQQLAEREAWEVVDVYSEIYGRDEWGTEYAIGVDGEGDFYVLNRDTDRAIVIPGDKYRLMRRKEADDA